jgi:hypothetical protein
MFIIIFYIVAILDTLKDGILIRNDSSNKLKDIGPGKYQNEKQANTKSHNIQASEAY